MDVGVDLTMRLSELEQYVENKKKEEIAEETKRVSFAVQPETLLLVRILNISELLYYC